MNLDRKGMKFEMFELSWKVKERKKGFGCLKY